MAAEKVCYDGGEMGGEVARALSGCSDKEVRIEEDVHFISLG